MEKVGEVMDRDKLQNLLDSLDEGPLGTRSDG